MARRVLVQQLLTMRDKVEEAGVQLESAAGVLRQLLRRKGFPGGSRRNVENAKKYAEQALTELTFVDDDIENTLEDY